MGVAGVRTPPYRIETGRLVIRCYEPADAPAIVEAVGSSLEHLRPWMPWVEHEPQSVEQRIAFCRSCRAQFDADENYTYGVFARDESRLLGGSGLHPRGVPGALEIGYFVRADALRQGIATEVTAVLTRVALELCGAHRVDVKVDYANEASLAVPRKLRYPHEARLRAELPPFGAQRGHRDANLFTMLPGELLDSGCAAYDYVAYDATGARL